MKRTPPVVTVLLTFVLPAAVPPCIAQTPQTTKFSARVQLVVQSDDVALKNQITSFIGRELRGLGDAVVVDDKPLFLISVVAYKTHLVTQWLRKFRDR